MKIGLSVLCSILKPTSIKENSTKYQVISASSIQVSEVRTPSEEGIGEIKDIMFDLSIGEFLGRRCRYAQAP